MPFIDYLNIEPMINSVQHYSHSQGPLGNIAEISIATSFVIKNEFYIYTWWLHLLFLLLCSIFALTCFKGAHSSNEFRFHIALFLNSTFIPNNVTQK